MADIQKLLDQLKSDDPIKRFDACEELRISPSIPDEAMEALRELTQDPNRDVADAAQRALDLHVPKPKTPKIDTASAAVVSPKLMDKRTLELVIGYFVLGLGVSIILTGGNWPIPSIIIAIAVYSLYRTYTTSGDDPRYRSSVSKETVDNKISRLSSKEQQIIQITYEAIQNSTSSTRDIADALDIPPFEAMKLKINLRKKMGVETNEELVKLAEEKGLINQSE